MRNFAQTGIGATAFMTIQKSHLRFNRRLITETLCKYPTTFEAFCELLNNAAQAGATEIDITIDYTKQDSFSASPFTYLELRDNGSGVHKDEFDKKLLEVATDSKAGGQGVGRFAGLQIGKVIEIESCGKSPIETGIATITSLTLRRSLLAANANLAEQPVDLNFDEVNASEKTFFRIRISDLYSEDELRQDKRRRIVGQFSEEKLAASIFEKYAELIFTARLVIRINGKPINHADYVIGAPEVFETEFVASDGVKHKVSYHLIQLNTHSTQHKIFLRQTNAGIQTVGHVLNYQAAIPEPHQWFAYVDSNFFDQHTNAFRTIELLGEVDLDSKKILELIRGDIDKFFAGRYPVFVDFIKQLKADTFYPYRVSPPASETLEVVFQQVAFAVETKHKLLARGEKLRNLVYQLIDRCLNNGELEAVLDGIVDLKPELLACFKEVMSKVELEEMLKFTSLVASKLQLLDFIFAINYGDISKHIKERSQLHKVVEKHLWLFGEEFSGTPFLWSDKNLGNTLEELRTKNMLYEPSPEDDNINDLASPEIKDITDLFFFSERLLSDTESEILVVELKAPRVKLSAKELAQAERYAVKIDNHPAITSNLRFRVILAGSSSGQIIGEKIGSIDPKRPSLVFQTKNRRVEVHVQTWSDIIDSNRRKLSCMGERMKVSDRSIREVFEADFAEIELHAELESRLSNSQPSLAKGTGGGQGAKRQRNGRRAAK